MAFWREREEEGLDLISRGAKRLCSGFGRWKGERREGLLCTSVDRKAPCSGFGVDINGEGERRQGLELESGEPKKAAVVAQVANTISVASGSRSLSVPCASHYASPLCAAQYRDVECHRAISFLSLPPLLTQNGKRDACSSCGLKRSSPLTSREPRAEEGSEGGGQEGGGGVVWRVC